MTTKTDQLLIESKSKRPGFSVSWVSEHGSRVLNEDAVLIKDNVFGVFDGASSFTKYLDKDGKTGAYLAANIAKDVFLNNDGNLIDLAKLANREIGVKMEEAGIDTTDKLNIWSTTAAVVKIDLNKGKFDWIKLDDSPIVVIYKNDSYRILVREEDQDRETLTLWRKLNEENNPKIMELFKEQKYKVRRKMNEPDGYGVLSGDERMLNFLRYGEESLADVKSIICLTDGMFIPNPDPQKDDDFDTWVRLYLHGGLNEVKKYIRGLEEEDPDLIKYPRFKIHDDASAVAINFTEE